MELRFLVGSMFGRADCHRRDFGNALLPPGRLSIYFRGAHYTGRGPRVVNSVPARQYCEPVLRLRIYACRAWAFIGPVVKPTRDMRIYEGEEQARNIGVQVPN